MLEILDIVDESDAVIGHATRAEIHRTRRIHRAVHMLLFRPGGQLFLQRRALTKDVFPDYWDSSAAGHVDHGEHYRNCAVRELEEELGIVEPRTAFHEFHRAQPCASNGFEHQRFYAVESAQELSLCPDEIAAGRWLALTEMDSWVESDDTSLTPDLKRVWPVYRAWSQA